MSTLEQAKIIYFEKEDILYILISEGPQCGSLELHPNITAELNDKGEVIGIEILNASTFIQREFSVKTSGFSALNSSEKQLFKSVRILKMCPF